MGFHVWKNVYFVENRWWFTAGANLTTVMVVGELSYSLKSIQTNSKIVGVEAFQLSALAFFVSLPLGLVLFTVFYGFS